MPVCKLESPAASSRAMTSGTPSIVIQRSCICWRVVTSAMFRPVAFVISPSRRA